MDICTRSGSPTGAGVYTLLKYDGTLTGVFKDGEGDDIAWGSTVWTGSGAQEDWFAVLDHDDGAKIVTLTLIPEPGVTALLLLGMSMMALRRRLRG